MRLVHAIIAVLLIVISLASSWYLCLSYGAQTILAPLKYAAIPIIALAITAGQLIFKFSDLVTSPGLNYSQIAKLRETISRKRKKLYLLCALYFVSGLLSFVSSGIIGQSGISETVAFWLGVTTLFVVSLSFLFTPYILVWHHEISNFYMRLAEEEEKRKSKDKLLDDLGEAKDFKFESDESIDRYNQVHH